jgi:hypothetical protein
MGTVHVSQAQGMSSDNTEEARAPAEHHPRVRGVTRAWGC